MPERDPDRLLEAFAELTEAVPRPPIPALRASRLRQALAAVLSLVLVASIAGLAVVFAQRLGPSSGGQRVEFLTHRMTDMHALGTYTGIAGALVVREGRCLYVSSWLAIWPAGTTIDETANPAVIRNAAGERITTVGDLFSLSGASIDGSELDEARTYLDREIPEDCAAPEVLLINPGVEALEPRLATWRIDPARPPDPSSTALQIEIAEIDNGCDPRGLTLPPEIAYNPDQVVIMLSILEIGGRCRGNPYYPITIELSEPLGSRALVDGLDHGVRWPPAVDTVTPSPVAASTPHPSADMVGRLLGTELAGPCSFIAADGHLWTVIWPDGYRIQSDNHVDPVLVGPDGRVEAVEGHLIGVNGVATEGMSPVCMTGQIFEAREIVFVDRSPESSLAHAHARARTTALADPLLVDYLIRHPYYSVEADAYGSQSPSGRLEPAVVVTARFFGPVGDYPVGSCDVRREVDEVVGVAWLIDETGMEILARSPIWPEDVRCF